MPGPSSTSTYFTLTALALPVQTRKWWQDLPSSAHAAGYCLHCFDLRVQTDDSLLTYIKLAPFRSFAARWQRFYECLMDKRCGNAHKLMQGAAP